MGNIVSIGEAARVLGVSVSTLRRWEASGKLESTRSPSGHRRYDLARLAPGRYGSPAGETRTIAYAREPQGAPEGGLESQRLGLERYCAGRGWTFEIVCDTGSGTDFRKSGLRRVIGEIAAGKVGRLVVARLDRILVLGSELVLALCEEKGTEVVITNRGGSPLSAEELAWDVLEMAKGLSARLYGARSRKALKLLEDLTKAARSAL